jgi:hypothetical protein
VRVLVPGRRGILIFLATALAGLTVWAISTPVLAYLLLGERAYVASYSAPIFFLDGFPFQVILAVVAGYVMPRGFWLRGLAVVFLRPAAEVYLTLCRDSRGAFEPVGLGDRRQCFSRQKR